MSEKGIYRQYIIKDGELDRRLPFCNRCGRGYFMADHGDRYSCGRCGFTIFKKEKDRSD
ncbi:30S ribosomal protein S27 [miscellaneous Crenarchaeota group-15 archaeon DG-45]|uniref:Small ribosomal subunit protein eS31 n=1 Tax=miscellaneous Crenarchaeota group-15 archaeon DG-45 TaxID=1685127 RepID=A0A0M0BRY2_9ARCH|nr:MAG: 30S ribosomal protein S27 [miscellaneous Crenarchaeota group-15 archaeon DG-45]